jgi:hypothetical protein
MLDRTVTTLPTTSATTLLTTVYVVPSTPTGLPETLVASATYGTIMEALPPISHDTPHANILLGLGVGLLIGVLLLAVIAGLYLWHRRRSTLIKNDINNKNDVNVRNYHNLINGPFKSKEHTKTEDDPEWSIESAEKVSITKNMRAQSVLTRSSSKRSNASSESGIAIRRPEQTVRMALTSHPLTPSYAVFVSEEAVMIEMHTEAKNELNLGGRSMQE